MCDGARRDRRSGGGGGPGAPSGGAVTHHALMYVVKHGGSFIYVQVESSHALSEAQVKWLTGKLELLALQ